MSMAENPQPRLTYRDMRTRAQEITDERLKERVLAGIDVLNEKYGPNWVDHVDASKLFMESGQACVLGQVYGGYWDGVAALTETSRDDGFGSARMKFGVEHGFFQSGDMPSYSRLNTAWRKVLRKD